MKADVSLLIDALTSERDSLNRAIQALKQITPGPVEPRSPRKPRPRVIKHRTFLTTDAKQAVVERMTAAPRGRAQETARQLGAEFKTSAASIYSNWRNWKTADATLAAPNGDAPAVQ